MCVNHLGTIWDEWHIGKICCAGMSWVFIFLVMEMSWKIIFEKRVGTLIIRAFMIHVITSVTTVSYFMCERRLAVCFEDNLWNNRHLSFTDQTFFLLSSRQHQSTKQQNNHLTAFVGQ